MCKLVINHLSEIDSVAREFLALIGDHKIIAFYGKMGSGKTTFIASVCKNLGSEDAITSPTFSLVNEYTSEERVPIFHFDFYRINDISEVYDIGYEDYFYSGDLCLLEWPELIESILPPDTVRVNIIENDDETRNLVINLPT